MAKPTIEIEPKLLNIDVDKNTLITEFTKMWINRDFYYILQDLITSDLPIGEEAKLFEIN